jgi:hypothetical protein
MVKDLANFLPAQYLPKSVRHDEARSVIAPGRKHIRMLLPAVRQHLPAAIEGG